MMVASWRRPQRRPILWRLSGRVSCEGSRRNLPVTEDTDEELSDDDPENFEVCDSVNPALVADLIGIPAGWPGFLEERCKVADGEEDVSVTVVSLSILR
jgi:hypothetical protein